MNYTQFSSLTCCSCRQPTPFDQLCYQVLDKEQGSHGSRVFADCDVLMRQLIAVLLTPEELKEWEENQSERDETYATQRDKPDSP